MNFLSTGEKIKRARIYKGVTLKELCKKDVSISKMSCIENDKIKAEQWILEMVAERLELDVEYLLYDDIMELENSVATYQKNKNLTENDFVQIKERFEYCLSKKYSNLAFKFIHILFSEYTKIKKFEEIKNLINIYNDLHEEDADQKQVYYEDLAKYFLARRNYTDAITYFDRAIAHIVNYTIIKNVNGYVENNILLSMAYYYTAEYEKSEKVLDELLHLDKKIESEEQLVLINGLIASNKMRLKKELNNDLDVFNNFENKDNINYAKVSILIAQNYFNQQNKQLGLMIIKQIKDNVNRANTYAYAEILLSIIEILLEAQEIDVAKEYSDEVLEISIKLDNHFLIERSYLYKARINRVNRSLIQWEMNMNLATDILVRFASAEEKKERYLEMAQMYHVIGETRETLKYLTLSMNLEKNSNI